ncbi:MAG TPA: hypothetical protein VF510_20900 [Ktedonobacterales bacterium]
MGVGDKKATKKPAQASTGFTDEERAAMREHVQEQKARARQSSRADCVLIPPAEHLLSPLRKRQ